MKTSNVFRHSLVLFASLVIGLSMAMCGGDERPFAVSNIPPSLREHAGAVVRLYERTFTVKNESRAVETCRYAVTIYRKEDRDNGRLTIPYDQFVKVSDLDATLYDAQGGKIRSLEKSDIKDYPQFGEYSLFQDDRTREASLYYDQYPYTVEFTYELSYDGYLGWPTWYSRLSRDPVQISRFTVTMPEDSTLRWWCNKDSVAPVVRKVSGNNVYEWSVGDQRTIEKEAINNSLEDCSLVVRIAPSVFEISDRAGSMRSWSDFGKWCYQLYDEKGNLPDQAKQDIKSLIQLTDTPTEKIRKVYDYMQSRTRYVSVQLGLGGWQPFDASYVHERGYGDCKALSNYTIALLKEAGITAYPVLVRMGQYRHILIPEFPSNQFDHVIVCVPLPQDTVWLECTDQTAPMDHLGDDLENRSGLMLTPDGGTLIPLPSTRPVDNDQVRTAAIAIDYFGDAKGSLKVAWHGDQGDYVRGALVDETPDGRLQWAIRSLGHPNAKLNGYTIDGVDKHQSAISMSAEFAIPRFAVGSQARLFFNPNVMNRRTYVPPEISQRLTPIFLYYPSLSIDSIRYVLPTGVKVEALPAPMEIQSSFGKFTEKTVAIGDTAVQFYRRLEIHEYTIPASQYSEYRKFFFDVVRADRGEVVLVKTQQ